MGDNPITGRKAWQPLTFNGVAAFAGATWKRLLLVQVVFALFAAAVIVWSLDAAWLPTVEQAIRRLPDRGVIRSATLDWGGENPCTLAEGRFLAFVVDLNHSGRIRSPADIQVEPGRATVRFRSFLGFRDFRYPNGWIIACNRGEVEPWWGAWRPPILWMAFGVSVLALLISWMVLATAGCLPAWLVGFFANRQLSLADSWKLAGASLMPGALLMTAAILAYGFGALDLVQFLSVLVAHLVVAVVFLVAAPFWLPRLDRSGRRNNPFAPPAGAPVSEEEDKGPAKLR